MELKNTERVLNEYGEKAVELYKGQLESKGINASSALSNSVSFKVEHKGIEYEVSLTLLEYWKWVEKGRRPGKMPPVNKILDWIKIKPVIPRPYNGKVPTEKQLSYLIARKIGREGTDARYPLRESLDELNRKMMTDIENALTEDLQDNIDEAFAILATK